MDTLNLNNEDFNLDSIFAKIISERSFCSDRIGPKCEPPPSASTQLLPHLEKSKEFEMCT